MKVLLESRQTVDLKARVIGRAAGVAEQPLPPLQAVEAVRRHGAVPAAAHAPRAVHALPADITRVAALVA